ncbi:hypothetical protein K437DRAFT_274794 [Tilletiaria anomala UBC 951]|uniref:Uncharacterized protein n=1 Tax=Tilletiaria anomala (strain ATCC 24038 / CBS 436.72 / UBC 951) TaxID=1037660 RepID=A0A066VY78_TILAU|nr:uncharacterized protein K437DRAFT_274794 [Tilletiaria anomala UBC 951]KDN43769.1 hypothetical protein K437DRAFT_274794 [Tilletiaria anomala UBC 951]
MSAPEPARSASGTHAPAVDAAAERSSSHAAQAQSSTQQQQRHDRAAPAPNTGAFDWANNKTPSEKMPIALHDDPHEMGMLHDGPACCSETLGTSGPRQGTMLTSVSPVRRASQLSAPGTAPATTPAAVFPSANDMPADPDAAESLTRSLFVTPPPPSPAASAYTASSAFITGAAVGAGGTAADAPFGAAAAAATAAHNSQSHMPSPAYSPGPSSPNLFARGVVHSSMRSPRARSPARAPASASATGSTAIISRAHTASPSTALPFAHTAGGALAAAAGSWSTSPTMPHTAAVPAPAASASGNTLAAAAPAIFERDIEHRDASHLLSKSEAIDVAIPSVLSDAVEALQEFGPEELEIIEPQTASPPLALSASALSSHTQSAELAAQAHAHKPSSVASLHSGPLSMHGSAPLSLSLSRAGSTPASGSGSGSGASSPRQYSAMMAPLDAGTSGFAASSPSPPLSYASGMDDQPLPAGSLAAQIAEKFAPSAPPAIGTMFAAAGAGASGGKERQQRPSSSYSGSVAHGMGGSGARAMSPIRGRLADISPTRATFSLGSWPPSGSASPRSARAALHLAQMKALQSPGPSPVAITEPLSSAGLTAPAVAGSGSGLLTPCSVHLPGSGVLPAALGPVASSPSPSLSPSSSFHLPTAMAFPSLPLPNPYRSPSPPPHDPTEAADGERPAPSSISVDGAVISGTEVATAQTSLDGLADVITSNAPVAFPSGSTAEDAAPYSSRGSPLRERKAFLFTPGSGSGSCSASGSGATSPVTPTSALPHATDAQLAIRRSAALSASSLPFSSSGTVGGAGEGRPARRLSFFAPADMINAAKAEVHTFDEAVRQSAEVESHQHGLGLALGGVAGAASPAGVRSTFMARSFSGN